MTDEQRQPTGDSPAPDRRPSSNLDLMRTAGQLGTAGLAFALALLIGSLLGLWLDKVTGWSPLFFIVFFIAGFAAGVLNVYRITRELK